MNNLFTVIGQCEVPTRNFVEIGSRDGADCAAFAARFSTPIQSIYAIEASQPLADQIKAKYPGLNVTRKLVHNASGVMSFNDFSRQSNINERGMGSMRERIGGNGNRYPFSASVDAIRGDQFMSDSKLDSIDVLKVDVEGCAYDVLDSFGKKIESIACIHVEAELVQIWRDQKLFSSVAGLLIQHGFTMMHFIEMNYPTIQCESIWVRRYYERT
jgi:FkbM family methyltransferase